MFAGSLSPPLPSLPGVPLPNGLEFRYATNMLGPEREVQAYLTEGMLGSGHITSVCCGPGKLEGPERSPGSSCPGSASCWRSGIASRWVSPLTYRCVLRWITNGRLQLTWWLRNQPQQRDLSTVHRDVNKVEAEIRSGLRILLPKVRP